ncbi:NADH dehydrogenase subunit 2 (mitochondrion) [Spodoptera litura]|uniref:NADH-ubiquinone oxidoreductase chain 2 n=1 Tax=Spodoptera litura TaxID=69820 RepID=U5HSI2_SPOLT|nr:NADH dehydrogenase subunit 2 [Spodoptera litura]AFC77909.1 NADH dehydrogenase subunit 2 [Spodoptera litura]AGZ13020.1 NADH dehydrogenase subunit 2 [Spodoptera litura]AHA84865.1 NADH dehydrogenase subunit 2 [Spodoptera litura]QTZ20363.1 NADH dehydrogenase subunit 2 [Spodoptera litura]UDP55388.1 NADH dehydrogenase subunit 2 [Spodoptera litura]
MYNLFNSNKMFFLFILFFSTLISISSNSWFGCWIGLEINLLSFIPLISNSNNLFSTEASLKYFLTQSIASLNFLFSILIKLSLMKNFEMNNFLAIMMNSSMLMKMGSVPFHFWFPNIIEGLSWLNSFILMTWQKITPLILMSYYMNNYFINIIIIFNIIIGAIGGLNQTSLRKLMAFSSINNLGWMIMSISISETLWIFYFMMYSFMISIMCFFFYILNMYFINQLFINNMNFLIKINILINFLSLGGLPPFIGFFPKWIIINFLINNNMYLMTFIFVMMSLIMLFFYIRISYSAIMFNYMKNKWFKIYIKNKYFLIINFFSFFSIMGMILSTLFFY